jgi:hypothetical protein
VEPAVLQAQSASSLRAPVAAHEVVGAQADLAGFAGADFLALCSQMEAAA